MAMAAAPAQSRVIRILFISLLLDLIAFASILPLFPRLLAHYQKTDSPLLQRAQSYIDSVKPLFGADVSNKKVDVVLFGGALGSLFSLLQCIFAPVFGAASDKYGRRSAMLISSVGLVAAYALWFVSRDFETFVAARVLGGIAKGNIHIATAIVADVTSAKDRAKGMAFIGIAFALGFIVGPAIGAAFSALDLSSQLPVAVTSWGVHEFSGPALFALALSILNTLFLAVALPETLPRLTNSGTSSASSTATQPPASHSSSLLAVFSFDSSRSPGLVRNIIVYFVHLFVFSGMEFTLSFLTFDRFDYSNMQQGRLYVYIGLVMVVVQGGYVRRFASKKGARALALEGFVVLIPGLALIGMANSVPVLFGGVGLMSIASGIVVPCLTTLASQYAPPGEKGHVLGIFRSVGALARALGPITACTLYWRVGGLACYCTGAAALVLPLVLATGLPIPPADSDGSEPDSKKED